MGARRMMMSLLRLGIGLSVLGMGVAVFFIICVVLFPSRSLRIRVCNVFGHVVGRWCLAILGARVPTEAQEQLRRVHPAIYVSNHTSIIDIFVGMWISPLGTCGTAKKEVVWYPFLGLLYLVSGHLRLDRSRHARAIESLETLTRVVLQHRLAIWIWPEGTRSVDGELLPFKKGFAHLALATGLPVVPVVIQGAAEGWRKHSLRITPVTLRIEVLEPISTEHWTGARLDAHVEEVHARFREALGQQSAEEPLADAA